MNPFVNNLSINSIRLGFASTLLVCLNFNTAMAQIEQREQKPTIADSKNTKVVKRLIAAFNQHDAKQMMAVVDEKCEVFYVDKKGKSQLSTRSSEALEKEMVSYFKALPDVKSALKSTMEVGRFVTVHEAVEWTAREKKAISILAWRFRNCRRQN